MAALLAKSFEAADEVRTPPLTKVDVVVLGSHVAARLTLEPGWRWSECVKPGAGTDHCEYRHVGIAISGHLHVERGEESLDVAPGEAYLMEPGHDAWVVGEEPFVGYEFDLHSAVSYASKS